MQNMYFKFCTQLWFQIQNDALRNDIRAKQVIIWKAFQLLKRFEGKPIPCVQKTSSQYFDQHLQEYKFKNQINNSDILKVNLGKNKFIKRLEIIFQNFYFQNELSITLAINALLNEKNRGYEGFLLRAQEENHRMATVLRNMNRKYRHLKLDLMNSETKRDIIMTQVKVKISYF